MTSPSWGSPVPGDTDSARLVKVPAVPGRRPGRVAPRRADASVPVEAAPAGFDGPPQREPRVADARRPDGGAAGGAVLGRPVRVRIVERFPGERVRHRTGPLRRIRSALALVLTAIVVGAVVAAALTALVWGISVVIHHATTS